MMNLDELKQILEMVREHELSELELERDGFKIRVRKEGPAAARAETVAAYQVDVPGSAPAAAPAMVAQPAPLPSPPPAEPRSDVAEVELAVVKSPIVGTFYRAPEPGAKPFVEVGQAVKKGQVLCIIEAMKLMNEIESEYSGEVVSVYVENGQPVQYGERLFAIRTK
jgi:acetyl-CoA carboxylase biotin carboxyl carrier protein